jgi:ABC-type uncharacterized transport system auxiliary subunit
VDHYYRIDAGSPTSRPDRNLAGNLQVDRLRTDAVIGERHLLYRRSVNAPEILQRPYHRWSDPPAILLQTALVSYLDSAEVAEEVMPATARVQPDFVVSGRLSRFEQVLEPSGRVVVELQLILTSSDGRVLVNERYREERESSSTSVETAASAFGAAVVGIFQRFLTDLDASIAAIERPGEAGLTTTLPPS